MVKRRGIALFTDVLDLSMARDGYFGDLNKIDRGANTGINIRTILRLPWWLPISLIIGSPSLGYLISQHTSTAMKASDASVWPKCIFFGDSITQVNHVLSFTQLLEQYYVKCLYLCYNFRFVGLLV